MKHKIAAVLGTTVLAAALSVVGGSPAFAPVASFRSTVDGRRPRKPIKLSTPGCSTKRRGAPGAAS